MTNRLLRILEILCTDGPCEIDRLIADCDWYPAARLTSEFEKKWDLRKKCFNAVNELKSLGLAHAHFEITERGSDLLDSEAIFDDRVSGLLGELRRLGPADLETLRDNRPGYERPTVAERLHMLRDLGLVRLTYWLSEAGRMLTQKRIFE